MFAHVWLRPGSYFHSLVLTNGAYPSELIKINMPRLNEHVGTVTMMSHKQPLEYSQKGLYTGMELKIQAQKHKKMKTLDYGSSKMSCKTVGMCLTVSLSWCWCSCCCDSGSNQPRSRWHSDCQRSAGAGFAVTSWATRTLLQSGAPSQTPMLLWSSWNWVRQRQRAGTKQMGGKKRCFVKETIAWQLIPGREVSCVLYKTLFGVKWLLTSNQYWRGYSALFLMLVCHPQQVKFREALFF